MRKKFIMRGGREVTEEGGRRVHISDRAVLVHTVCYCRTGGMFWDVFWDGLSAYGRQCVREQPDT